MPHDPFPPEPRQHGDWIQLWAWRHAWRSLARRPAFFVATVLTLAFGAGVTTAVFSLVDTVLVKPLPYPDADALVTVYELSPSARDRRSLVAPGRLQDWQRANRSFVSISATYNESVTDTSAEEPERLAGVRVAPRFFEVYGRPPLAGRWFSEDEERETGPNAAVISERFWIRRFNRAPSAIGQALMVGGKGYPIVGIMPSSFTPATTDVWLPAKISSFLLGQREARFLNGIGRLKPGVTIEQAAQDLALVQEELARQSSVSSFSLGVDVRTLGIRRTRAIAIAPPSSPPTAPMSRPSRQTIAIARPLDAPSAARTASSRARRRTCTSVSPAMFATAISQSAPTDPNSRTSPRRELLIRTSLSERTSADHPVSVFGNWRASSSCTSARS